MKRVSLFALLCVCASGQAQTPQWFASRFGLTVQAPMPANGAPMTSFQIPAFQDGKPGATSHNDPGIMSGALVKPTARKYRFDDPGCAAWAEMLSITDKLPANTWLRVDGMLNSHFFNPYDAQATSADRITDGVIGRLMFRGNDPANTLNLLFVVAPGVVPHSDIGDSWTTINVDPLGAKLATPIKTGAPKNRDWYRPENAMLPYLKQGFQKYVNLINDSAAQEAKKRFGAAAKTFNFVQKLGFQLGNEPATGHPGGSSFAPIGSWSGLGRVTDGYSVGVNYSVSPAVRTALGIPTSFGSNPLTLPAFSFLAEGGNQLQANYVGGRLMNFMNSGAYSAAFNEMTSYSKEMVAYKWSQQCGRRALHFRSPMLRWKLKTNDYGEVAGGGKELLFYGPLDPKYGAWETPEEYAVRWVQELERGVDGVAELPMPTASKIVDITECYFPNGDLGLNDFNGNMVDAKGNKLTFADKTLEQVRELGRTCRNKDGKFQALLPGQVPPSRAQLMVAIRNELYNRDMVQKNLSKNLGRIFLWSSLSRDCRWYTGLNQDNTGNVVGYNPWTDFRLSVDEMKAFWNVK